MIGQTVGSYRVVRPLGRGGMGTVWAGEHVALGNAVAIKVLLPEHGGDAEAVQRFFNEARAAARVRTPGIVQVLDFGRTGGGDAYLVMELLDGITLRQRLREQAPLPIEEAATITRQIATTLAAAHAAGIVHRDLKPDNIMLVPDPEVSSGERAKVLDFGIAKLTDLRAPASVQTRTGSLLGTPYYMSPEQCRGTGEVDHRADIYALGCILFELVCGRPPFVSDGVGELVGMHQFVAPPAPRSLRPELSEGLERAILRALEKEPAQRFASMDELAGALEGAAPAARPRRSSGPPRSSGPDGALDATIGTPPSQRDTQAADALAETVLTPRRESVKVIASAQAITSSAGDDDPVALERAAQARAIAMAEALAHQERDARGASTTAAGGGGRTITVIAVAVVVLAGALLYAKIGRDGDDHRDTGTTIAQGDRPRPHAPADHVGAPEPKETATGAGTTRDLHGGFLGSGTGAGTGAGSGSGYAAEAKPDPGPRDAGARPEAVDRHAAAMARAVAAIDAGRYADALVELDRALQVVPADAATLVLAAVTSCRLADRTRAAAYLAQLKVDADRDRVRTACAEHGVTLAP